MTAHDQLLKQLKDPKQCNAELTVRMRMLVLDPFKPDLARPESLTRAAQPTRGEFVERSTQLGPLAIQIVNQNLKTLDAIKIQQQQTPHNVMPKIAVHCLITTCLYAVAALRCMGTCSYLKPLDLEKTLSNLIGKMVSVGEHAWALDELRKLRVTMDQYVKPRPTNTRPKRGQSKTAATATATALLKEDTTPSFATSKLYSPTMPDQAIVDSYGEWLVFPMDATVRDTNRIMLMIAYQLNFIRAWCSLRQGRLLKYLPEILFKSGNAFEWAQHLSAIDPAAATKQFDSFYKTLLRAGKLVRSDEGEKEALAAYRLQAFAYKAMVLAGTTPLSTVCDSVLRLSILYEKAASPSKYQRSVPTK
ncbi:hypothetical protein BDF14DRAFT_1736177 [Spinellus fusiger]|nr:hypothetical protein BDF14DRAFT_1736177 [Spinellus fusiger]